MNVHQLRVHQDFFSTTRSQIMDLIAEIATYLTVILY